MKTDSTIIAVDFDGTLADNYPPPIGKAKMDVINRLIKLRESGAQLILWTCRNGDNLTAAIEWCKEKGLEFDSINEDVEDVKNTKYGQNKSVKVRADFYLDDKSLTLDEFLGTNKGEGK